MGTDTWETAAVVGLEPARVPFPQSLRLAPPPPLTAAVHRESVPGRWRTPPLPAGDVPRPIRANFVPDLHTSRRDIANSASKGTRRPRGGAMARSGFEGAGLHTTTPSFGGT